MGTTLNDMREPAEVCRENGWMPGTLLVGDEGYGPTVIEITAVGEERVLARTVSHDGQPSKVCEGSWVLWCRDWHVVPNAQVSQQQRDILRHALGCPKNYRNHFCTGAGSDDFADCEALVTAGMMTRSQKDWVPDFIYTVTEAGKLLANSV